MHVLGRVRVRTAVIAMVAAGSGATFARADCLNYPIEPGGDPLERVVPQVAVVSSPAARTHFVRGGETAGCPSDVAVCRARAYVVPHDTVLTMRTEGTYACALLPSPKGTTTTEDWLPASALTVVPWKPPALRDWLGRWRTGDQYIAISMASPGLLAVQGDATFGSHDPERLRLGGVNTGQVEGTAAPQGDLLAFVQDEHGKTLPFTDANRNACRIRMRLAGPFLWVWEDACGGLNVTFTGAYARVSR